MLPKWSIKSIVVLRKRLYRPRHVLFCSVQGTHYSEVTIQFQVRPKGQLFCYRPRHVLFCSIALSRRGRRQGTHYSEVTILNGAAKGSIVLLSTSTRSLLLHRPKPSWPPPRYTLLWSNHSKWSAHSVSGAAKRVNPSRYTLLWSSLFVMFIVSIYVYTCI
jgi:hypothetical protein